MDAESKGISASDRGSERGSEGGQTVELTDEQRSIIRQGRVVMFFLLCIFILCAIFKEARLTFCIIQLTMIGSMACVWDEDSFIATSDEGFVSRLRGLTCQCMSCIFPLGCAGWMIWIMVQAAKYVEPVVELGEPFTFVNLTGLPL